MKKHSQKGFTLIELLVVITIIGLLSSLAVVSLNTARVKARDALRKADMAQMRTALSLYYMDHNGYPVCGTYNDSSPDYGATVGTNQPGDGAWCYYNTLKTELTSGTKPIIQEIPVDPKTRTNDPAIDPVNIYRYVGSADGESYVLVYTLEESDTGNYMQVIRGF
jgi:prepilin-type N-terminal cleavage/methylation domain-containing protein